VQDGLVDLIFANEEEASTLSDELGLAGRGDTTDVKVAAAQSYLLQYCQVQQDRVSYVGAVTLRSMAVSLSVYAGPVFLRHRSRWRNTVRICGRVTPARGYGVSVLVGGGMLGLHHASHPS
jgi:hypothetical protein